MPAAAPPPRTRFVIERLDVDGDGIPDGDLVKEYVGDRLVRQKFVALDRLKNITDDAIANAAAVAQGPVKPQKVVYERMPAHPEDKPVIVQSDTSFGHYVKAGAGLQLGSIAMDGVVSGLASLFSSDGGGARGARKSRRRL